MMNDESILLTIKRQLDICDDYGAFDPIIITHINSVFMTLDQLGVSPVRHFAIAGENEKWSDYLLDRIDLNAVKSYMYLKVRLLFDPPNVGVLHEAIERQIAEFEWRLNVQCDPVKNAIDYPEGEEESDGESDELCGVS